MPLSHMHALCVCCNPAALAQGHSCLIHCLAGAHRAGWLSRSASGGRSREWEIRGGGRRRGAQEDEYRRGSPPPVASSSIGLVASAALLWLSARPTPHTSFPLCVCPARLAVLFPRVCLHFARRHHRRQLHDARIRFGRANCDRSGMFTVTEIRATDTLCHIVHIATIVPTTHTTHTLTFNTCCLRTQPRARTCHARTRA